MNLKYKTLITKLRKQIKKDSILIEQLKEQKTTTHCIKRNGSRNFI